MSTVKGHHILLRHRDNPALSTYEGYIKDGGFKTWKQVVTGKKGKPAEIKDEVHQSGLRGRGGAGFPTGLKWKFVDDKNWPHYLVVNADESEPGTFKDREIMESNAFQFLEGVMISAYAIGANAAYIYLRGEFWDLAHALDKQIERLKKDKLLGKKLFGTEYELEVYTHLGAGAYICGEETALLESLEGKLGQPRVRPPFPPAFGLYGKPTVVNNVETLANVGLIMEKGAKWYKKFGTERSSGTKVFSLSGSVKNPGNVELPLGTTYRELIYKYGGGIVGDKKIKAIMSAGASSSLIIANDKALDTPMTYEDVPNVGAQLGSASIIVIDESVDLKWLISKTLHFFKHESCGKCTPCREGTYWMSHISERILSGEATQEDVDLLKSVANNMRGTTLCALGDFSTEAVISSIERFPKEFKLKAAQPVREPVAGD